MKRVGIITMHKVPNYGSALQAYATQRVVESIGHKAEIIDYDYPNDFQRQRSGKSNGGLKANAVRFIIAIKRFLGIGKQSVKLKRFSNFYSRYYNLSKRRYMTYSSLRDAPPVEDVYMTGSDQVWNTRHTCGDDNFALSFVKDSKSKIAFSASFAQDDVCDERLIENIKLYSHVSVREKNGQHICERILGRKARLTLDPTLMLTAHDWNELVKEVQKESTPYILLYALDYVFDPFQIINELVNLYSDGGKMRVISVGAVHVAKSEKRTDCGPMEFVSLVANASIVITNSYHGTAFAINMGRPFISVLPPDNADDRQATLLNLVGLTACAVSELTDVRVASPFYDADNVQRILSSLRNESFSYLVNAIGK